MDFSELAVKYEKTCGGVEFLKAVGSAVNKLLVDKGLVTEDELKNALASEITMRNIDAVSNLAENQTPTTNYMQVVKCSCGEEVMCSCGRCKGCGAQRSPDGFNVLSKLKSRWTLMSSLCDKGLVSTSVCDDITSLYRQMYSQSLITEAELSELEEFCQKAKLPITENSLSELDAGSPLRKPVVSQESLKSLEGDIRVLSGKVDQLWKEVFFLGKCKVPASATSCDGIKPDRQTLCMAVHDLCTVNNATAGIDNCRIKVDYPKAPWDI